MTNDKGEPLSGATVTEKGTTNATTAKEDGSFSLTVASEKSVLVISYVGFDAQEIVVGNKNYSICSISTTSSCINRCSSCWLWKSKQG